MPDSGPARASPPRGEKAASLLPKNADGAVTVSQGKRAPRRPDARSVPTWSGSRAGKRSAVWGSSRDRRPGTVGVGGSKAAEGGGGSGVPRGEG